MKTFGKLGLSILILTLIILVASITTYAAINTWVLLIESASYRNGAGVGYGPIHVDNAKKEIDEAVALGMGVARFDVRDELLDNPTEISNLDTVVNYAKGKGLKIEIGWYGSESAIDIHGEGYGELTWDQFKTMFRDGARYLADRYDPDYFMMAEIPSTMGMQINSVETIDTWWTFIQSVGDDIIAYSDNANTKIVHNQINRTGSRSLQFTEKIIQVNDPDHRIIGNDPYNYDEADEEFTELDALVNQYSWTGQKWIGETNYIINQSEERQRDYFAYVVSKAAEKGYTGFNVFYTTDWAAPYTDMGILNSNYTRKKAWYFLGDYINPSWNEKTVLHVDAAGNPDNSDKIIVQDPGYTYSETAPYSGNNSWYNWGAYGTNFNVTLNGLTATDSYKLTLWAYTNPDREDVTFDDSTPDIINWNDGQPKTVTLDYDGHKNDHAVTFNLKDIYDGNGDGYYSPSLDVLKLEKFNRAPTAEAGNNQTVASTVTLNASGSSDIDGTIEGYIWNFGDGYYRSSTSTTVTHTYKSAGVYTVELMVVDDDAKTAKDTVTITVTTGNANTMHVYGIGYPADGIWDGICDYVWLPMYTERSGETVRASGGIKITDKNNNPVVGATVEYGWSGAYTGTGSGVTNSDGKVFATSGWVNQGGIFKLAVTNVTKSGWVYDQSSNYEDNEIARNIADTVLKVDCAGNADNTDIILVQDAGYSYSETAPYSGWSLWYNYSEWVTSSCTVTLSGLSKYHYYTLQLKASTSVYPQKVEFDGATPDILNWNDGLDQNIEIDRSDYYTDGQIVITFTGLVYQGYKYTPNLDLFILMDRDIHKP